MSIFTKSRHISALLPNGSGYVVHCRVWQVCLRESKGDSFERKKKYKGKIKAKYSNKIKDLFFLPPDFVMSK